LLQKLGADGEIIATTEFLDLANVSKGGTHDNSGIIKLAVVVVDLGNGDNARIFVRFVGFVVVFGVPIKDPSNERRDQSNSGFSTGHCLLVVFSPFITKKKSNFKREQRNVEGGDGDGKGKKLEGKKKEA